MMTSHLLLQPLAFLVYLHLRGWTITFKNWKSHSPTELTALISSQGEIASFYPPPSLTIRNTLSGRKPFLLPRFRSLVEARGRYLCHPRPVARPLLNPRSNELDHFLRYPPSQTRHDMLFVLKGHLYFQQILLSFVL